MAPRACSRCTRKKVRCDNGRPCNRCDQHGVPCEDVPQRPRFRHFPTACDPERRTTARYRRSRNNPLASAGAFLGTVKDITAFSSFNTPYDSPLPSVDRVIKASVEEPSSADPYAPIHSPEPSTATITALVRHTDALQRPQDALDWHIDTPSGRAGNIELSSSASGAWRTPDNTASSKDSASASRNGSSTSASLLANTSAPHAPRQVASSLSAPAASTSSQQIDPLTSGGAEHLKSIPGVNPNQPSLTIPRGRNVGGFLLPVANSTPFPAERLCNYLCAAAPEVLDCVESRTHTNAKMSYIFSFLNLGVLVEVTAEWFDEKVAHIESKSINRSLFCQLYTEELRNHGIRALGLQDSELCSPAHWWSTDKRGDGVVWPCAVGEMVIRWLTPASLVYYVKWIRHQSDLRLMKFTSDGRSEHPGVGQ